MAQNVIERRPAAAVSNDDRLLRGAEVAEILGSSIAYAYRLMAEEELPVIRFRGGKTVRVPYRALMDWIKTSTRGPRILS